MISPQPANFPLCGKVLAELKRLQMRHGREHGRRTVLNTPIRRLEGISYWVIEDVDAIDDYINTEIRREWETDARSEYREPEDDPWLKTLRKRKWRLEVLGVAQIKLNPDIMNYVDPKTGYVFSKSLERRSSELRQSIELGGVVLSPLIVKKEDYQLVDGYCRHATLNAMRVSKTLTYIGSL